MGVSHNVGYIRILSLTKKFFYIILIHYTAQSLAHIGFGGMENISYICISEILFNNQSRYLCV